MVSANKDNKIYLITAVHKIKLNNPKMIVPTFLDSKTAWKIWWSDHE